MAWRSSHGFPWAIIAAAFVENGTRRLASHYLVIGILIPLSGVWLISQQRPIYMDRYFSVLLPILSILVALGAKTLWSTLELKIPINSMKLISIVTLTVPLLIGISAASQVHLDDTYTKETWQGLSAMIDAKNEFRPIVWFSDPESVVALRYYAGEEFVWLQQEDPPECRPKCWWVLRQPYTATHAFSQSISIPDRTWLPDLPEGCFLEEQWRDNVGLLLWRVSCLETP